MSCQPAGYTQLLHFGVWRSVLVIICGYGALMVAYKHQQHMHHNTAQQNTRVCCFDVPHRIYPPGVGSSWQARAGITCT